MIAQEEVTVSAPRVSGMPDPVSRWDPGRSSSSMDQYAFEGAGPAGPADHQPSVLRRDGVLDQPDARVPSQMDTEEPPAGACGTSLPPTTRPRQASSTEPMPGVVSSGGRVNLGTRFASCPCRSGITVRDEMRTITRSSSRARLTTCRWSVSSAGWTRLLPHVPGRDPVLPQRCGCALLPQGHGGSHQEVVKVT